MKATYTHLSAEERGAIMAMKFQDCSIRSIARALGRCPSTISRELRRNGYKQ
ncbi:MAG: helix-turn-helix domain-containing protein, partial [Burkholderiales bacterium]|nr:helix-turn-helix domain-containing protein [Burkholderiales bacterium]